MTTSLTTARALLPAISQILPGIFIGDGLCTRDSSIYTNPDTAITAVISITVHEDALWENARKFTNYIPNSNHMHIKAADSETQDLLLYFDQICDFMDKMLDYNLQDPTKEPLSMLKKPAVLVHCEKGVSRSASAVIAYVMRNTKKGVDEVLAEVQRHRRVRPSPNFMEQLKVWEETGYDIWLDSRNKLPKKEYQVFLNRRLERLRAKGKTSDEPVGLQNL